MNNEIIIDGVTYVKKEYKNKQVTNKMIIERQELEWGETCNKKLNWREAKKWCEDHGDGWRLPTVVELLNAYEQKIDGFDTSSYWSSTEHSETYARYVNFSDGFVNTNGKAYHYSVRCVRGL